MNSKTALFSAANYKIEDSVGYLMARTRSMLSHTIDDALVNEGITCAQGALFLLLASGKCNSAADLAREMYIDSAAMKRMLDRLEAGGFVLRTPNPDDKRQFKLSLSEDGKAVAERLPQRYVQALEQCFAGFSQEEIGFLKSLLRKILANQPACERTDFNCQGK